jgi:long-chain acyl-CoA synthetase
MPSAVTVAPTPVFGWHPQARLVGPDGQDVPQNAVYAPVLPDRPGGAALAAALAGSGAGFRIGGDASPPEAGFGGFETLTGGSLGHARRVVRSQASWLASFAVNAALFGIGPGKVVAVPGRLSHSLALYGALEGLSLGAQVHLLDGLRPDRMARAVAERRVQVIYATPVHVAQLAACGVPMPDLRLVLAGGARLGPGDRDALARVAPGASLRVFYGAAETSFVTLAEDATDTVGQPYPGVALQITDPVGADVPDGTAGEVWVRSPYLFDRYAGADPGGSRWRDGWLSVGEIGAMTPAGLVLHGRAGRMVTIAGHNVFPEAIEAFLAGLPGVSRVAVLPRPDTRREAVLVAVIQGDPSQQDAILAAARAQLGPLVAPRALIWVQDWPLLGAGKTDLRALQARVDAWR